MTVSNKSVIVVGGGAGGLAAGVLLQHAGYSVRLLEKNATTGGKLNRREINGFVFDTGPSILTMPGVLRLLFSTTEVKLEDYLELIPLSPQWRCFFPDGMLFDFHSDQEAQRAAIATISPGDADGYDQLLAEAKSLYDLSAENFFFRDVASVGDMMRSQSRSPLEALALVRVLKPYRRFSEIIERHIREPHLRQAFEHMTQYVGSSPFLSPAVLALLVHVQMEKGCWYVMGGLHKIAEALTRRFLELGGEIQTETTIERVEADERTIKSIVTGRGKSLQADSYVFNTDINTFLTKLVGQTPLKTPLACSGVVIFVGLHRRMTQLAHHNFFFSQSHRTEFEQMYDVGRPTDDPTIYVCAPSVTDSTVAPAGGENLFLLIHAPTLNERTDWQTLLPRYKELIYAKLERMGLSSFTDSIAVEEAMSPEYIASQYGTYRGNIYGLASHSRLTGGFKPGNRSRQFTNAFFAGGTVNPGAGVPMAIMSGMIAGSELMGRSGQFVGAQV